MLKRGLTLTFLFAVTLVVSTPRATSQPQDEVPSYNAGPPPKGDKLAAILSKDQLSMEDAQNSYQTHAYELAAKIPGVRALNGGKLENARIVESITALLIGLNIRYKVHSAGIRFTGLPAK